MFAVARAVLPKAQAKVQQAIVDYAKESGRNLAAIDSIATHARYVAGKAGRDVPSAGDIWDAMTSLVIPSDATLQLALGKSSTRRRPGRPSAPEETILSDRETEPDGAAPVSGRETVPTSNEIK